MPELIPAEPGSPEWLAARRAGVTATDIATILGLSPYDSAYSLFWRKMGQVPEPGDSDRFRLGRELEPYVANRWSADNGLAAYPGGLYRHGVRSWQMATLDRKVGPLLPGYPIELKTWADADRRSWINYEGPPPRVRAQMLWQMDVMDVEVGHVGVVFLPSGEFRSYTIEHGNCQASEASERIGGDSPCSVCTDLTLMRAAGEEFMRRLRLELPPPGPDSSAATLAAVRARFTRQPDKTAEVDKETWIAFESACDHLKAWKEGKTTAESQLREQAGEASVLTVDGQPVARRIIAEQQVKAHVRQMDYLKRIKMEEE